MPDILLISLVIAIIILILLIVIKYYKAEQYVSNNNSKQNSESVMFLSTDLDVFLKYINNKWIIPSETSKVGIRSPYIDQPWELAFKPSKFKLTKYETKNDEQLLLSLDNGKYLYFQVMDCCKEKKSDRKYFLLNHSDNLTIAKMGKTFLEIDVNSDSKGENKGDKYITMKLYTNGICIWKAILDKKNILIGKL